PTNKFVGETSVTPVFVDQELRVPVDVSDYPKQFKDPLLPTKIPVTVHLPTQAISSGWIEDADVDRPGIQIGKSDVLITKFDKTKRAEYEGVKLPLAVSVAGIPRAYRFIVSSAGTTAIAGGGEQGARIFINLLKPQTGTILLGNKDELSLEVAVDARNFDKAGGDWRWEEDSKKWVPDESRGIWRIKSQLVNEGDEFNPQIDSDDTRIYWSFKRRISLQSLKNGVWKLQPSVSAYPVPDSRIQQFLKRRGRFQFIAVLTKDGEEIARDSVRLAIDDDKPVAKLDVASGKHDVRKPLSLTLQSQDKESGIGHVVVWIDKNSNQKLDKNEDIFERHYDPNELVAVRSDNISLQPAELPTKVEKFVILATVTNGANLSETTEAEIILDSQSVAAAVKPKTGALKVTFSNSRGIATVVTVEGPKKNSQRTKNTSVTFGELPPGDYKILVVQGSQVIKEGMANTEVKVGRTSSVVVTLKF
ncbi:MAG: hypothetical protein O3A00_21655, partial [Planctomycetota bacterium]|nr:hypothetical protein [Planctomycetota bacterium]